MLLPRHITANWANVATCNLCHELLRHVRTRQDWLQTHPTQWATTTIPIRIKFEQTSYINSDSQEIRSILWNLNDPHRVDNSLPLLRILRQFHFTPPPHYMLFLRSILILSFLLSLGLRSGFFPSDFPTKTLYASLLSPKGVTCPVHSFSWFYHPNSIWWEVQITKASRYVVSSTPLLSRPT